MNRTYVYCTSDEKSMSFFVSHSNNDYYLFTQDFHLSVKDLFANGVEINRALDYSRAFRVKPVMKTISKLPVYIKYIEKEYGIQILEQTKKKQQYVKSKKAKYMEEAA